MPLPPYLAQAIQQEIENTDPRELARAAAELTKKYKVERFAFPVIRTTAQRAAYLAIRFPATFAVNQQVFSEIHRLAPGARIGSFLDLGAGPGTALDAAAEVLPSLTQATMIEAESSLIEVGRRLCARSPQAAVRDARWLQQDINTLSCEPHDLVVISYVLGELPPLAADKVVLHALRLAKQFLVIIEPGTVRGFNFVYSARSSLVGAGAHLLAPCPHAGECPMAVASDWCHFAARVERTSIHRQLKGGALSYEDEKFSYVVASRQAFSPVCARIVRHPQKHSGHVQLTLCTPHGLQTPTVGKSQKEKYKSARQAQWGDAWD